MRSVIFILMLALSPLALAQNYVEVSGQANIQVPADFVQLNIGLDSHHKHAAKAARANATQMATLVDFMLAQGVDNKDMQTQQLNLQAQYDYNRNEVNGYTASRTMQVKVRNLNRLDQLLVDLAELGGNRLHGYHAGIDDPQAWQAQLLTLATDNARNKAHVLAASQALLLGQALQITEANNAMPPPRAEYARVAAAVADAVPASTQVGDINLQTSVRIRFALLPK